MVGFTGKARKKSGGTHALASPSVGVTSPTSSTEAPRSVSSAFSRVFSGRYFRSSRGKGFSDSPTSVADVTKHGSGGLDGFDPASLSEDDFVHHSVTSIPRVSANVAALHARTIAAADVPSVRDDIGADRLEKRRTPRLPLSFGHRRGSSASHGLSENWLIDLRQLTIGKTIGHSSFGSVNEGKLNGTKVAVKTVPFSNSPNSPNSLTSLMTEAELNCKLRHPNIVLFMGISILPKQVCIVTELMARGHVRDMLLREKRGKLVRLDWLLRLQWALDTAQGMAYLHSHEPPVVHRDLKTTNLLVDRGMNVKICDFGLSRVVSRSRMSAVGTVQFAAPEVLRQDQYSEKADVFSFGTVLWELYTRKPVFEGLPHLEIYTSVVEGLMPSMDEGCDERYRSLMEACWTTDAASRPSFREIIDRVVELVGVEEEEE